MSQRHRSTIIAVAALATAMLGTLLGVGARTAAAPPAIASTDEDGANWVPFIGDFQLWCTSGNPGFSGCQRHHNRPAMDIGMPVGTTIRSAGTGTVQYATNDGDGRGTYVQILHAGGRTSHYYHLSSVAVSPGQAVVAGDVIGASGNTGSTTSPHLHYEEKDASGTSVEPGVMHSVQNGVLVDYPTAGGSDSWFEVPYGTRIVNEGYDPSRFSDVGPSTWNYAAIEWAVDAGVAAGFPDGTWRNTEPMDRAQAVMWIWRTAGEPEAAGSAPHPDVPPTAWYRPGLDWAAGVPGMLDRFGPNFESGTPVTRGQLAVMQWARAGKPTAASIGFPDVVDGDAIAAADWSAARGYMLGYEDGTFRPDDVLSRGAAVMALYRERLFDDVSARAWNRPAVDWARWRAYMVGFPDNTFRPADPISRAQTVMLLWRHAGQPAATASAGFTDIGPGTWFEGAADWAAENGIVVGYPDGTFRGNDQIGRDEFVMMLWRRAGQPVPGQAHAFTDVSPGAWYEDGVSWAAEQLVVLGYGDGTFRGGNPINRGQSINSFFGASQLPV
jgi:hypothetical protein